MAGPMLASAANRTTGSRWNPRPFNEVVAGSDCKVNSQRQRFRNRWLLTGVTRNSAGVALGNCTVDLFTTSDDLLRYTTTSDASGNFSFSLPSNGWRCYLVAYKAGDPDMAGTTVDTLYAVYA